MRVETRQTLWDFGILLALGILVFISNLGGYPLFDVDEPRYAETAREMLLPPFDWITPHFNWQIRFDKPPLFYWLIASSYKLFGVSEFSARVISACAAILVVLMLYAVIKKYLGRKEALASGLIFISMAWIYVMGRWAITDMTLSCFMVGSSLAFFMALAGSPRWYLLAGLFTGFGLLTKGPIALALPGLVFLIALFTIYRSQWKEKIFSIWILLGLGTAIAIAWPWYSAVAQANPDTFIENFFGLHNIKRFEGTVSGHSGPIWYYIPVLLAGCFPWCLALPALVRHIWIERKALPAVVWYSIIWFSTVFIFFSIAGTKLATYILPGFPALAIMLGWFWFAVTEGKLQNQGTWRWLQVGLCLGCAVLGVGLLILLVYPYKLVPPAIYDLYQPSLAGVTAGLLTLVMFVSTWWLVKTNNLTRGFYTLAVGLCLTYTLCNWLVLPMAAKLVQYDILGFAQKAVQDGRPLATYRMKKPSLVYYTGARVDYVLDKDASDELKTLPIRLAPEPMYAIMRNRDLETFFSEYTGEIALKGRVYSLVHTQNLKLLKDVNQ